MEFELSAEFARWLNVEPRRWNNFEAGYPFSRGIANKLVEKIPGLSRDWLFDGNPRGLSIEMARRLGEEPDIPAPKQQPAKAERRRKRA
jgi:hypothetical protein